MARPRGGLSIVPDGPGFAELFAALPVAVLVLDPEGCVAHANSACEAMLNQSERSMLGQPLAAVMRAPADYDDRRQGHGFAAFDAEITTPRGARFRADFIESIITDHPGWRTVALHNAAATRRMGHSADRASVRAAVGAAAMLAHEIKNPLSGIRGAAQLLAGGDEGSEVLTRLITTEVDRIAALIDRMQDFTDTRPPSVGAANIYPLLDHVRQVAVAGFARGTIIEEQFDPSLPPALLDPGAFVQIVLNLLKNACEAVAGQPEARVTITTAYRHGMSVAAGPGQPRRPLPIELCVIDNGPGAPDDIADHLFDPFVSGKPEGQGLGLALVDKLVRDLGGIIQYAREGVPPHSVFRLLLPRATE